MRQRVSASSYLASSAGVAALLSAGAVWDPSILFVLMLGAMATIVWKSPVRFVYVAISVEGFALAAGLLSLNYSYLSLGSFVLGIVAVARVITSNGSNLLLYSFAPLVIVVTMGVWGTAFADGTVSVEQSLAGVRIFATPVFAGVVALHMTRHQLARVVKLGIFVVLSSAVASLLERYLGASALIAAGLEYGTGVRTFGEGDLRAPGLFGTNYSMGAFAGIVAAVCLIVAPVIGRDVISRAWQIAGLVGAVVCLLTSIYRTGFIVFLVSAAVWVCINPGRLSQKFATILGTCAVLAFFIRSGYTSSSSLTQRQVVWGAVLDKYPLSFTGHGIGVTGAASNSRFSSSLVVTDNYYLSLTTQLGFVGILAIMGVVVLAVSMIIRSRIHSVMQAGCVLIGCLVGFWFVDFWEYSSAMMFALVPIGYALGRSTSGSSIDAIDPDKNGEAVRFGTLPQPR